MMMISFILSMKFEPRIWQSKGYWEMNLSNILILRHQKRSWYKKGFYLRGLHKKNGKFSHALDHIIWNQHKFDGNDHTNIAQLTWNTMDMSKVDVRNKNISYSNCKRLLNAKENSEIPVPTLTDNNTGATASEKHTVFTLSVIKNLDPWEFTQPIQLFSL